jgi:hypothetical protein
MSAVSSDGACDDEFVPLHPVRDSMAISTNISLSLTDFSDCFSGCVYMDIPQKTGEN